MLLCALTLLAAGSAREEASRHAQREPPAPDDSACCGPQFHARGGHVLMDGKRLRLKGLSWFGFEGDNAVADGLWQQPVDSYLEFFSANQFNAMRVPLALNNILSNPIPSRSMLSAETGLMGEDSLWLLEKIVMRAASKGILVLLDMHRLNSSLWPDPQGLWYSDKVTFEMLKGGWKELARRFCKHWNVFGADLLNEPHGGTWASGEQATDWDAAAEVLGNTVLAECARWVVLVEGIGQAGRVKPEYFWGENLEGVRRRKLRLHLEDKVIYSPHVYGPGLSRLMHYFDDPQFAQAMPQVWHAHFGFLLDDPSTTVILGEFGGPYNKPADIEWQRSLVEYLVRHGHVSSFYWCLNPNAGDTGGVLQQDWKTPNKAKLELLRPLDSSNIVELMRGSKPFPSRSFGKEVGLHEVGGSVLRCRTSSSAGGEPLALASVQRCNGVAECSDHSDEEGCRFSPCVTIGGPDAYKSCRFPFFYNGRSFKACTMMDAQTAEPWCPTDLDPSGSYSDYTRSGVCGPACPKPPRGEDAAGLCGSSSSDPNKHCAPPPSPPPAPPSPPPAFQLAARVGGHGGSMAALLAALALLSLLLGGVGVYTLRRERWLAGLAGLAAEWEAFTQKASSQQAARVAEASRQPPRVRGAAVGGAPPAEWWYLDEQDRQYGPLSAESVIELHRAGLVTSSTLVWSQAHCEAWQEFRTSVLAG
ncbi:hypothetical protein AB1Y20_001608 [Prymnesium parvum]|uniref:Fibronectin type-II domain-containing protein n=1 Tax=Prymnesium parvum TaxID=97485 RepID=A0AB34KDT2_PRYPA